MTQLSAPVGPTDHILGPPAAPVTLVEYGDFECPNCKAAFPVIRDLVASFGDRLQFVWRHFPITLRRRPCREGSGSDRGRGVQGKFWEMHDILFLHQEELDAASLLSYARALDLDAGRFEEDMASGRFADRVYADLDSGQASGVSWTPTFFINGERYPTARDLEGLVRTVTERVQRETARR